MKPKVNNDHEEILDYYCFNSIDVSNIKNKIKIIECENIGISYGQYFAAVSENVDCDYHIFIEDDYVPFKDYFENDLIDELKNKDDASLICSFIYNRKWDIISYAQTIGEPSYNISLIKDKLLKYNSENVSYQIPDFSLGAFSKNTIAKILEKFETFDNIKEFFNIPFTKIWLHQIFFGYLLGICNVPICDLSKKHMNIFYETVNNSIFLCNFDGYVNSWKNKPYLNEKFDIPLFVPIDMFVINNYENDLFHMKKYLIDETAFINRYNYFKKNQRVCINNLSKNLIFRNIDYVDFKGYLDLMYEFTNYQYKIDESTFNSHIDSINETGSKKILIVFSQTENKIIGAGTIFKLEKLHNNPIGQIEDVIVTDSCRGLGLGKLIVDKLTKIGLDEFKCYKITLNCLDKNIDFYKKCNFCISGTQMKLCQV
jgi:glucosamine-phosphate N-acetyltransferase